MDKAHDWKFIYVDKWCQTYQRDHDLPFEIAQDVLMDAWICSKCGCKVVGSGRPGKHRLIVRKSEKFTCNEYVVWYVQNL